VATYDRARPPSTGKTTKAAIEATRRRTTGAHLSLDNTCLTKQ
jgi:hypothetical protein